MTQEMNVIHHDLPSRKSSIYLCRRVIDLFAVDKSRYFDQFVTSFFHHFRVGHEFWVYGIQGSEKLSIWYLYAKIWMFDILVLSVLYPRRATLEEKRQRIDGEPCSCGTKPSPAATATEPEDLASALSATSVPAADVDRTTTFMIFVREAKPRINVSINFGYTFL